MRYLQLLAVLLLATVWVSAQKDHASANPNTGATTQNYPSHDQTTPVNTGGEKTLQGCLSGSDGNYTLMVKNGTSYRLNGDTAKLAEHIGHEVKVTGTVSSATSSPGTDTSASTSEQSTASGGEIQVTSFKHVAKTCQSGMSH